MQRSAPDKRIFFVDIKKAIITAAGKNQPTLPLQTLVDRDGVQKTALAIILEEVLKAGIEEICVVVRPGDQTSYRAAAGAPASSPVNARSFISSATIFTSAAI